MAELEDAGVIEAGVVAGEDVEDGFAELGAAAGAAVACGLSELLDCGDWPSSVTQVRASTVTTSAEATSSARDSLFALRFIALRFIVLVLTEMHARWNAGPPEFRHDGEESG